jgi:multidrug resistance efflux pump
VAAIDMRSEYAGIAQKVFDECGLQQKMLCWPENTQFRSITSPICGQLVRRLNARVGVCLPLTDTGGRLRGACIFLWAQRAQSRTLTPQVMDTLSEILASGLAARERRPLRFRRLRALKTGDWKKFKSVLTAGLLAAVVAALALVPVSYRVKGPCTVTPVVTRFVTARFDGILEAVYCKPGALVKQGELLARMDGRVIELELTSLNAELKKARKMRDIRLASGNTAAGQIALLEGQRLEQKIKLQLQRKQQLDIKSPIDGIVLSGKLEGVEGSPVRKGQSLFEISPLENMMVEVAVSQEDISYVRAGMPVRIEFDAYPRRRWEAGLDTILPRSEMREGISVFVGQVAFANPDGRLRPGMQGKASIVTQPKSIAWIYFHRPWNALLRAVAL